MENSQVNSLVSNLWKAHRKNILVKTSSLPKLEAHHRNPDCITSTWGLPKKREVYDILSLPEQLWSSSEQMFSFRFQNSQLSVYILCHDLTKAQFSCTSMRNEIVMPARIILQADILNFPFLCYSWENKALNYEETVIFNFKFFLNYSFFTMSKILGQKGQLKHTFFVLCYENKADPIPYWI